MQRKKCKDFPAGKQAQDNGFQGALRGYSSSDAAVFMEWEK